MENPPEKTVQRPAAFVVGGYRDAVEKRVHDSPVRNAVGAGHYFRTDGGCEGSREAFPDPLPPLVDIEIGDFMVVFHRVRIYPDCAGVPGIYEAFELAFGAAENRCLNDSPVFGQELRVPVAFSESAET